MTCRRAAVEAIGVGIWAAIQDEIATGYPLGREPEGAASELVGLDWR